MAADECEYVVTKSMLRDQIRKAMRAGFRKGRDRGAEAERERAAVREQARADALAHFAGLTPLLSALGTPFLKAAPPPEKGEPEPEAADDGVPDLAHATPHDIALAMVEHTRNSYVHKFDPTEGLEALAELNAHAAADAEHDERWTEKAWDAARAAKHPRKANGQFIKKQDIKDAAGNPKKEAKLLADVKDGDRGALEAALKDADHPLRHTARERKRKEHAAAREKVQTHSVNALHAVAKKVKDGSVTPEDVAGLAEHLKHVTKARMELVFRDHELYPRGSSKAKMVQALLDHAMDHTDADVPDEADDAPADSPGVPTNSGAEPATTGPKEPWQMTRDELFTHLYENPDFEAKFDKRYPGGASLSHGEFIKDAVKAGKPVPLHVRKEAGIAEPHELTRGERVDQYRRVFAHKKVTSSDIDQVKASHRRAVEQALAAGKPVPPEVLADYPDLAGKQAPAAEPLFVTPGELAQPDSPWAEHSVHETLEDAKRAAGPDGAVSMRTGPETIGGDPNNAAQTAALGRGIGIPEYVAHTKKPETPTPAAVDPALADIPARTLGRLKNDIAAIKRHEADPEHARDRVAYEAALDGVREAAHSLYRDNFDQKAVLAALGYDPDKVGRAWREPWDERDAAEAVQRAGEARRQATQAKRAGQSPPAHPPGSPQAHLAGLAAQLGPDAEKVVGKMMAGNPGRVGAWAAGITDADGLAAKIGEWDARFGGSTPITRQPAAPVPTAGAALPPQTPPTAGGTPPADPQTELAKLPPQVRASVERTLGGLKDHADALLHARTTDKMFRGNGRYEREVHDKGKDKRDSHLAKLNEFRKLAGKNGIDADAVIAGLGGMPAHEPSPAGRDYKFADESAAGPSPPAATPADTSQKTGRAATLDELPQQVASKVRGALQALRAHQDARRAAVVDTEVETGAGRGTVDEAAAGSADAEHAAKVEAARKVLDEFRAMAGKNGIDPESVIASAGGMPPDGVESLRQELAKKYGRPAAPPQRPAERPAAPPPQPHPALDTVVSHPRGTAEGVFGLSPSDRMGLVHHLDRTTDPGIADAALRGESVTHRLAAAADAHRPAHAEAQRQKQIADSAAGPTTNDEAKAALLANPPKGKRETVTVPGDAGPREITGTRVGPFVLKKREGTAKGYTLIHTGTGLSAGDAGSEAEARSMAGLMMAGGDWNFTDAKKMPHELREHGGKVAQGFYRGKWAALHAHMSTKQPPAPRSDAKAAGPTTAADGAAEAWQRVTGGPLTAAAARSLAGVPDGVPAAVRHYDHPRRGPMVEVTADGDGYRSVRLFWRDPDGTLVAKNHTVDVDPASPHRGQGTAAFARQVDALRAAGVGRIETTAGGGPGQETNGYYTLPRWGYEGQIEDDQFGRLPAPVRAAMGDSRSLRKLFDEVPGGPAAWKAHGGEVEHVRFDPRPGSPSSRALAAYTAERAARGAAPRSDAKAAEDPAAGTPKSRTLTPDQKAKRQAATAARNAGRAKVAGERSAAANPHTHVRDLMGHSSPEERLRKWTGFGTVAGQQLAAVRAQQAKKRATYVSPAEIFDLQAAGFLSKTKVPKITPAGMEQIRNAEQDEREDIDREVESFK